MENDDAWIEGASNELHATAVELSNKMERKTRMINMKKIAISLGITLASAAAAWLADWTKTIEWGPYSPLVQGVVATIIVLIRRVKVDRPRQGAGGR